MWIQPKCLEFIHSPASQNKFRKAAKLKVRSAYTYYKVHQISKWKPLSLQALWIRVWIKGILTTHHLKGTSAGTPYSH